MKPEIHSTLVSIIGEREGLVQHSDESNRTGSNCKVETNTWVVVLAVAFYLCGYGRQFLSGKPKSSYRQKRLICYQ